MTVRRIEQQEEWNAFLYERTGVAARSTLLQSWEWLAFQEQYEQLPVLRLFVEQEGKPVAAVALSVRRLIMGKTILFSASAPLLRDDYTDVEAVYQAIVSSEEFTQLAKEYQSIFWRFAPVQEFTTEWLPQAKRTEDIEPSLTSMIDLLQTEDEMLSAMKSKTRYNIRLAGRKGVQVKFVSGAKANWKEMATAYWNLLMETNQRHGISAYPKSYYENMFTYLGEAGVLEVATASYQGEVVAMNIVLQAGKTTTYLHGASTHKHKKVMAPYILQWESIKRAKETGSNWYDFYGVAPEGDTQHKLAGVTRFKRGFAGESVQYAGMYEYPISSAWYTMYQLINRFRK